MDVEVAKGSLSGRLGYVARWMRANSTPLALRPGFAGFTAMLGGLAGLLGTLYTDEIKSAIPFEFGWTFMPHAAAFWVSLIAFGWCFASGFKAQMATQKAQALELKERVDQLERLITTLPPEGFLSQFEDYYLLSHQELKKSESSSARLKDISAAIQTCLMSLVALAHAFDGSQRSVRFAANLMIFRPMPADRSGQEALLSNTLFLEGGADPGKLAGVLELHPEFRIAIDNRDRLDERTPAIALPIPDLASRQVGRRTTVLPGAPSAFCSPDVISWWRDTAELGNWCREYTALRSEVAAQMDRYFESDQGNQIRSFVCLPFGIPKVDAAGWQQIFGVVNIHANIVDILGETGVRQFVPLTMPFLLQLATLWPRYELLISDAVAICCAKENPDAQQTRS